jgi:hypothetical protein
VGLTALPASFFLTNPSKSKWVALLAWHVLAFADLAGVVRAALVNGRQDPESMRPLTHFPLSLMPAMLVSLTFMMHITAMVQIVRRLRAGS